ncbi:MAG: adenine deaminase, partial [Veillonella sp.]|nr:adenine deaminase [Veillonella sp.]
MDYQAYKRYSAVARGLEAADVVLKGAYILDVFTDRWVQADLALCDQIIVGIGAYEGKQEIDCQGRYIVPGFV